MPTDGNQGNHAPSEKYYKDTIITVTDKHTTFEEFDSEEARLLVLQQNVEEKSVRFVGNESQL